ncbi:unnamed protein product, partial [Urochloa humidicola]
PTRIGKGNRTSVLLGSPCAGAQQPLTTRPAAAPPPLLLKPAGRPLLSSTSPSALLASCGSWTWSSSLLLSKELFSSPLVERGSEMPHRARPMTGLLVFMGVNLVLVNTISPVYDFVCFHPYWERRRERRQRKREALQVKGSLETTN